MPIKFSEDTNRFILSPHFKAREFECHCGCKKLVINPRLLAALERTRGRIREPMIISSGVRCVEGQKAIYQQINRNRRLMGLKELRVPKVGYHVLGVAVDTESIIAPEDELEQEQWINLLRLDGWIGIGIQHERLSNEGKIIQVGFTHLDVRSNGHALWYYGGGR